MDNSGSRVDISGCGVTGKYIEQGDKVFRPGARGAT